MSPTIPPLSLHGLEFIKRMQGLALAPIGTKAACA